MKKLILLALAVVLSLSLCACQRNHPEQETEKPLPLPDHYPDEIFATDADKEQWYSALVRLLANQQEFEGAISNDDFQPLSLNENAPTIPWCLSVGVLDITGDFVPEVFLNMGGGSSGNNYFEVYSLFTGKHIASISGGGGNDSWAIYYDMENEQYTPIGRYDWRIGDSGSQHFINTTAYDKNDDMYYESPLFYAEYDYERIPCFDENGNPDGYDLQLSKMTFHVNGEPSGSSGYNYDLTQFYQTHSLVPHTGLTLFYWGDVTAPGDSKQECAEKMAHKLLFESGQKFVKLEG